MHRWISIPGISSEVKENHGVYFEEIIVRCGLEIRIVVITVAVNPACARFQQQLNRGLENYCRRGYQIALKFDYSGLGLSADQLILALEPHCVSVSALSLNKARSLETLANLRQLSTLVNSIGGDCILTQV